VIEHHEVIFDESNPHGPPRSLPSLLSSDDSCNDSNDDYQQVSTKDASFSLFESFLDDSQLVGVDLATFSLSRG